MGGICSRRSTEDNFDAGGFPPGVSIFNNGSGIIYQTRGLPAQQLNGIDDDKKKVTLTEPFSILVMNAAGSFAFDDNDGIPRIAKSNMAAVTKVSEVSSLLGKARTAGFEKAVEVLDTLGSSVTSIGSGFASRVPTKGNKITILSFEVANAIVKGATLMQSLSKDNIKHMKEVVLPSEGVQHLNIKRHG